MPQYARPASDIAVGDWVTSPLYSKLNDASPNDATYIVGDGITPGEVKFGNTIVNPSAGDVTFRVRFRKDPAEAALLGLQADLVQGTTVIKTQNWTNVGTTFSTAAITLTSGERAAITDWSDLRMRLTFQFGDAVMYGTDVVMYGTEVVTYG